MMSDPTIPCRERADLLMVTGRLVVTADLLLGGLRALEAARDTRAFLIEVLATAYKVREQARLIESRLMEGVE